MQIAATRNWLSVLSRFAPVLLIAACLAVLLVFIGLGQFAHPSSDDFCMAAGVNEHGLGGFLWKHYLEWSGRYSGNALYAVYPLLFDLFEGYRYIALLIIAALFYATAFFLSTLFTCRLHARPVMLASVCFVCIYLLGMMSPASGLYWMAGAFTYQTANILLLVALALMLRLQRRQKQAQRYSITLLLLLIVMVTAIGANETSMLVLTAVAIFGCAAQLRSGRRILLPWLLILVFSLVCFAVVYFSPGNAMRAADFPLRHDLGRSISGSLSLGLKILWIWISSPLLIVSTMLAPFAFARLMQSSAQQHRAVSKPVIAMLGLCTLALPFVLQFPAWWSMGGWPPARTLDVIYFTFLLGWFLTVGAVTVLYLQRGNRQSLAAPQAAWPAAAVLVLSVLFSLAAVQSKAFMLAKSDLFELAQPYHDYLDRRYLLIEQARANNRPRLLVADFTGDYPRSIYFNDIMHNPGHWRNVCYADYFGLEEIKRDKNGSSSARPGQVNTRTRQPR